MVSSLVTEVAIDIVLSMAALSIHAFLEVAFSSFGFFANKIANSTWGIIPLAMMMIWTPPPALQQQQYYQRGV